MPSDVDAQQLARDELATAMVPAPDDLLSDVGPLAQLYFLNQCAEYVMKAWVGMLQGDTAAGVEDDSEPVRALAAIANATGQLAAACQLVSIFDRDA
jgi:hypothetical protein